MGFTPPRKPLKFAKNTCRFPSTRAMSVASQDEAVTCTASLEFKDCRNLFCVSGDAAAKSCCNAAEYALPGQSENRTTCGESGNCVASWPVTTNLPVEANTLISFRSPSLKTCT